MNSNLNQIPEHILRDLPFEETKINWELVDRIRKAKEQKAKENAGRDK